MGTPTLLRGPRFPLAQFCGSRRNRALFQVGLNTFAIVCVTKSRPDCDNIGVAYANNSPNERPTDSIPNESQQAERA
jgi:hypothetical protein